MQRVCKYELALSLTSNMMDSLMAETAAGAQLLMQNNHPEGPAMMALVLAMGAGRDAALATLLAHQRLNHGVGQEGGPTPEEYNKPLIARSTAILDRLNTDINSDPPAQPPPAPEVKPPPTQLPN